MPAAPSPRATSSSARRVHASALSGSRPSATSIAYALEVRSANGATGTNLVLTVQLPSGLTATSATTDRGSGCSGTTTVTCQLDFISGNLVAHVNVVATVATTQAFTTTASVKQNEIDPSQANNTASVTTTPPALPAPPVAPAPKIPPIAFTKAPKAAFVSRSNKLVLVSASFAAANSNLATVSLVNNKTKKVQPLFAHSHLGTTISRSPLTALRGRIGTSPVAVALFVPQDVFVHPGRYTLKLGISSSAGLSLNVTVPVKKLPKLS
jgi:hypothetical protein